MPGQSRFRPSGGPTPAILEARRVEQESIAEGLKKLRDANRSAASGETRRMA